MLKKLFFLIIAVVNCLPIAACNLCLGVTKPRFLQQKAHERVDCNCPCWQYTKSKERNTCFVCGHRVMPEQIKSSTLVIKKDSNKKKHKELDRTYKRWYEAKK